MLKFEINLILTLKDPRSLKIKLSAISSWLWSGSGSVNKWKIFWTMLHLRSGGISSRVVDSSVSLTHHDLSDLCWIVNARLNFVSPRHFNHFSCARPTFQVQSVLILRARDFQFPNCGTSRFYYPWESVKQFCEKKDCDTHITAENKRDCETREIQQNFWGTHVLKDHLPSLGSMNLIQINPRKRVRKGALLIEDGGKTQKQTFKLTSILKILGTFVNFELICGV